MATYELIASAVYVPGTLGGSNDQIRVGARVMDITGEPVVVDFDDWGAPAMAGSIVCRVSSASLGVITLSLLDWVESPNEADVVYGLKDITGLTGSDLLTFHFDITVDPGAPISFEATIFLPVKFSA